LCDQVFNALLYTGASVSAIAENTFNILQKNLTNGQSLNVLPVNDVTVYAALRFKNKKVTSQVLLLFSIANFDADCIFLVIQNLYTPLIIDDDWLFKYKVILDYQTNLMKFPRWGLECPFRSPLDIENPNKRAAMSFMNTS